MWVVGLMVVIFFACCILGQPIFLALGLSGTICNFLGVDGVSGTTIALQFFNSNNSWTLLAAPFFLLSGNLMAACGPAEALFKLCDAFLGHIKGGIAIAVVVACAMFGAVTGSAIATAIAIGATCIPEMRKRGYDEYFTMGLVGCSATLGLMIPPSIYMILFAGQAQGNLIEYFTAGYLPGIVFAIILAVVAMFRLPKTAMTAPKMPWNQRGKALVNAIPALGMPILIMVSIYSGLFTPTESAALSVAYCLIVCPLAYRHKFTWKECWKQCCAAGRSNSQIFIILGAVYVFSNVLTYLRVGDIVSTCAVSLGFPALGMMFMMAMVYFIFGMFIDPVPIMYLTLPIFLPIVEAMNIPVTYFMIMTVAMMMVAQVSPPFGIILFTMSGVFKASVTTVIKGALPYIVCLLVGTVIVILFPELSLFLPRLMGFST